MHHPAVTFMLKHLQKLVAIEKVMNAVEGGEIQIPEACELCGRDPIGTSTFRHLNGYDELHQYDITWLCMSCSR